MVDMAEIAAAVTSLKTAADIAKGLIGIKNASEIQGKVIELQDIIVAAQSSAIAAQSEQFTLLERIRESERKLADLEAWKAESDRYQLTDYGGGTFAYELKSGSANGEPRHRICPNCYQAGRKSILQHLFRTATGQEKYECNSCKTEYLFGAKQPSGAATVRVRRGGWDDFIP